MNEQRKPVAVLSAMENMNAQDRTQQLIAEAKQLRELSARLCAEYKVVAVRFQFSHEANEAISPARDNHVSPRIFKITGN